MIHAQEELITQQEPLEFVKGDSQRLLTQKIEQNNRLSEIILQQRPKDQVVSMFNIETYVSCLSKVC